MIARDNDTRRALNQAAREQRRDHGELGERARPTAPVSWRSVTG